METTNCYTLYIHTTFICNWELYKAKHLTHLHFFMYLNVEFYAVKFCKILKNNDNGGVIEILVHNIAVVKEQKIVMHCMHVFFKFYNLFFFLNWEFYKCKHIMLFALVWQTFTLTEASAANFWVEMIIVIRVMFMAIVMFISRKANLSRWKHLLAINYRFIHKSLLQAESTSIFWNTRKLIHNGTRK